MFVLLCVCVHAIRCFRAKFYHFFLLFLSFFGVKILCKQMHKPVCLAYRPNIVFCMSYSFDGWNESVRRTLVLSFDVLLFLLEKCIRVPLLHIALIRKNEEEEKKADDGSKEKMSFPFLLFFFRRLCSILRVVDGRMGSLL